MSEKKSLTRETCTRYQKSDRKDKQKILDEFCQTTGYNRKYAIRVLHNAYKTYDGLVVIDGKTVRLKKTKPRPKNRLGKKVYGEDVKNVLHSLWEFFWFKCGKYLVPLIRDQMGFLQESREPDFHITPEIKAALLAVSPATVDRLLAADKAALRGKGVSGTRMGEAALLRQIPVRTHYSAEERMIPGYFQADTVHHCGNSDSGEFNLSLTVTDVSSGWTELRALQNKAHKWTLTALKEIYDTLPFPMRELHSDNGGEFINYDTLDWWKITNTLALSRSRPRHSNDNAFAEQKNNAVVRNYIGYSRFDTEPERAALARVYRSLCPLLNFFIPNKKLVSKTTIGSKTRKIYDRPQTSYQRLLDSPFVSKEIKDQLRCRYGLLNPVSLQHSVHKAVKALLQAHNAKVTFSF